MARQNLLGKRFGRLLVVDYAPDYIAPDGHKHPKWKCRCDCGNEVVVRQSSLLGGCSQSCGCLRKEQISYRAKHHGGFGTRLYNVWNSMRQRCNNPHAQSYHNYGGRGISICSEWDDYGVFRDWALKTGYDKSAKRNECTLERIDVDGDYCPQNCKWVTMKEQGNNRRDTIYLTYKNETHSLSEWSRLTDIPYQRLYARYKRGKPVEKILRQ